MSVSLSSVYFSPVLNPEVSTSFYCQKISPFSFAILSSFSCSLYNLILTFYRLISYDIFTNENKYCRKPYVITKKKTIIKLNLEIKES